MSSKLNFAQIVADHFSTLRNETVNRTSKVDIFVFFVVPAGFGVVLFISSFEFSGDAVTIIITSLSIFSGLLINVLLLIFNISKGENSDALLERFLKEVYANLSYSVFIAFLAIVVLVVSIFFKAGEPTRIAFSALAATLVLNFVLTLLMALKRIHILLGRKFRT